MTANKLADEIEQLIKDDMPPSAEEKWLTKIATMLRQQQAEIEALKKEVQQWKNSFHKGVRV